MKNILIVIGFLITGQACSQSLLWEKAYGSWLTRKNSNVECFDYKDGFYALSLTEISQANNWGTLALADSKGDTVWTRKFNDALWSNFKSPVKFFNNKIYYMPHRYLSTKDTVVNVLKHVDLNGNAKTLGEYIFPELYFVISRDLLLENKNLWFLGLGVPSIPGNKGGGVNLH